MWSTGVSQALARVNTNATSPVKQSRMAFFEWLTCINTDHSRTRCQQTDLSLFKAIRPSMSKIFCLLVENLTPRSRQTPHLPSRQLVQDGEALSEILKCLFRKRYKFPTRQMSVLPVSQNNRPAPYKIVTTGKAMYNIFKISRGAGVIWQKNTNRY